MWGGFRCQAHFPATRCRDRLSTWRVSPNRRLCYRETITKRQVKAILDRVLTWPADRQADIAHVVEFMEEQDNSTLRLSDEQLAEVRRRRAEKRPRRMTLDEFNKRLRRRYGV